MLGLNRNHVSLNMQSDDWAKAFEEEKQELLRILKGEVVCIEHIGSTAIPGLKAKPILDIAIGVHDVHSISTLMALLTENGYEYRQDHGSVDRILFVKGPLKNRTHHLHIEDYGKKSWNDHLHFRDYLLKNPCKRHEYEVLKVNLARRYPFDRDKYTSEKAAFIQSALKEYRRFLTGDT